MGQITNLEVKSGSQAAIDALPKKPGQMLINEQTGATSMDVSNSERVPIGGAGEPGPPGEDGRSAYDLAVADGFSGSIEDWLESLRGEDGIQAIATDLSPEDPGFPKPPGKFVFTSYGATPESVLRVPGVQVTQLAAGGTPTAEMIGTPDAPVLKLGIPAGANGLTPTVSEVRTVTLNPGEPGYVEVTGPINAWVITFGLPVATVGGSGSGLPVGWMVATNEAELRDYIQLPNRRIIVQGRIILTDNLDIENDGIVIDGGGIGSLYPNDTLSVLVRAKANDITFQNLTIEHDADTGTFIDFTPSEEWEEGEKNLSFRNCVFTAPDPIYIGAYGSEHRSVVISKCIFRGGVFVRLRGDRGNYVMITQNVMCGGISFEEEFDGLAISPDNLISNWNGMGEIYPSSWGFQE